MQKYVRHSPENLRKHFPSNEETEAAANPRQAKADRRLALIRFVPRSAFLPEAS
jgi:hypothetical protein